MHRVAAQELPLDLPFDLISTAVRNFAAHHNRDPGGVTIAEVQGWAMGIRGWANDSIHGAVRNFSALHHVPAKTVTIMIVQRPAPGMWDQ